MENINLEMENETAPKNKTKLKALGLVDCYGKFLSDFSSKLNPLFNILPKNHKSK